MINLQESVYQWPLSLKIKRAIWNITWRIFGYYGPRLLSPWRKYLLKLFGAKIGKAPLICGQVKLLMPWNLEIEDYVSIAEGTDIYNFAKVTIGSNTVISQGVWLCTGTHDYTKTNFPLIWAPISVGCNAWIASEAFISPGIKIGDGAVIAARSVVTKDVPEWMVCAGMPAKPIKQRVIKGQSNGI